MANHTVKAKQPFITMLAVLFWIGMFGGGGVRATEPVAVGMMDSAASRATPPDELYKCDPGTNDFKKIKPCHPIDKDVSPLLILDWAESVKPPEGGTYTVWISKDPKLNQADFFVQRIDTYSMAGIGLDANPHGQYPATPNANGGVKYYWKVDEVDSEGKTVGSTDVSEFTVDEGKPAINWYILGKVKLPTGAAAGGATFKVSCVGVTLPAPSPANSAGEYWLSIPWNKTPCTVEVKKDSAYSAKIYPARPTSGILTKDVLLVKTL